MRTRNLLLFGNGFDLAHKIKSSYWDFISNTTELCIEERSNNGLLNSENRKEDISFKEFLLKFNQQRRNGIILKNIFYNSLIQQFNKYNWCDLEEFYFQKLLTIPDQYTYQTPMKLNEEFDFIKNNLQDYLFKQQIKEDETIELYNSMFRNLDKETTLYLNFNYTNTLEFYSEVNQENILHIHGKLYSESNPIIFGYASTDDESLKLIEKNDNEFLRNIKKHCYKRTNIQDKLLTFLNGNYMIRVFILGHSCGISDKLILSEILNHKNVSEINLMYYKDYEGYYNQQINIMRIINNNDIFKKLKNYEDSIHMPQIDDSDLCIQKFENWFSQL